VSDEPQFKTYPIALIRWADAHCGEGGWQELDYYEDDGECIVTSVGYLIPVGDPGAKADHVTLWQTITQGEGIHPFHVPVGMVRSLVLLATAENRSDG
jgi:hypothetical protein